MSSPSLYTTNSESFFKHHTGSKERLWCLCTVQCKRKYCGTDELTAYPFEIE